MSDTEIVRMARRLADLEGRIAEALEFAEDRHDIVDGPNLENQPNEWMQITNILQGPGHN